MLESVHEPLGGGFFNHISGGPGLKCLSDIVDFGMHADDHDTCI